MIANVNLVTFFHHFDDHRLGLDVMAYLCTEDLVERLDRVTG